jgi:hypothetical protein
MATRLLDGHGAVITREGDLDAVRVVRKDDAPIGSGG